MKLNPDGIHVAISFDENYITPFYVLATSIFLNNKKNAIIIHSITSGVGDTQKSEIANFVQRNNAEIFFYELDPETVSGLVIPENTWFTLATYYRLFFPELVPQEIEKLIYLDTDTLAIKDLRQLYHIDIGSKPIGAVREKIAKTRPEVGNYDTNNYFNAGVLLINIREWKKQGVTAKAVKFYENFLKAVYVLLRMR